MATPANSGLTPVTLTADSVGKTFSLDKAIPIYANGAADTTNPTVVGPVYPMKLRVLNYAGEHHLFDVTFSGKPWYTLIHKDEQFFTYDPAKNTVLASMASRRRGRSTRRRSHRRQRK